MNFQGLGRIENYKFHLDVAFKKAKKAAGERRNELQGKGRNRMEKSRIIELARINAIKASVTKSLSAIIQAYPSLDSLAEFYRELVRNFLDYPSLKKALGSLGWAIKKINEFSDKCKESIKKCGELEKINEYRRNFYGRASSVLRQIKDELNLLEESRKIMQDFPSIKQNTPTIAIAGFPNVGKTTLLFRLTGSKPDIQPYAFTTKKINVGYLIKNHKKIQFLDTPGTLDRFNKMNPIEKQAYLAIKYCAEKIIYVFDLSSLSGFSAESQLKLYKRIREDFSMPVYIYFSRMDVLERKLFEDFVKENKLKEIIYDIDKIKEIL